MFRKFLLFFLLFFFSFFHSGTLVFAKNSPERCLESLERENAFYFENVNPNINANQILRINTSQCIGNTIALRFYDYYHAKELFEKEEEGGFFGKIGKALKNFGKKLFTGFKGLKPAKIETQKGETLRRIVFTPKEKTTRIKLVTHESICYGGNSPDCQIFIVAKVNGYDEVVNTIPQVANAFEDFEEGDLDVDADSDLEDIEVMEAMAKEYRGALFARCSGSYCGKSSWILKAISGADNSYGGVSAEVVKTYNPAFDRESPCFDQTLNNGKGGYREGCYEFLAPIDTLQGKGIQSAGGHTWINNIKEFKLGDYINILFRLAVSALVIISVIMLMVAGVEYMTVESLFAKSEARTRIMGAIGGLILAAGTYLILYTINPRILNIDAIDNISQLDFEVENSPVSEFKLGKGGVLCSDITAVQGPLGKISVCKETKIRGKEIKFAENVQKLLDAAKKDGIILHGYGYRPPEVQINLRKQNCGTSNYDIYKKPPGKCKPPTARPGTSRHENGLAIDFTCDGVDINSSINISKRPKTKKCFDWLKRNAGTYGLKNFPRENWHWSFDGR